MIKVYSKFGDFGYTKLLNGNKVLKSNIQIIVSSNIDRTIIMLSSSMIHIKNKNIKKKIFNIIDNLFFMGAELSNMKKIVLTNKVNKHISVSYSDVKNLEANIDYINEKLPTLKNFLIPINNEVVIRFNIARNAVRLLESSIILLKKRGYMVRYNILKYINRLSDFLFLVGRYLSINEQEVKWNEKKTV